MRDASFFRPPAASTAFVIASMPDMVKHCFRGGQALPAAQADDDHAPMKTAAPLLAEKIRFLIDEGFVSPAQLVAACNVSKQAITGWRKTGRVAKDHLHVIADLAGVTVEWLLSADPPLRQTVVDMRAPKPRWPFLRVSWDRYLSLSRDDKADLDQRVERIILGYEASSDSDPRKATPETSPARVYYLHEYRSRRGE